MKEEILLWLCDYSYRITAYLFWLYFAAIIILDFFDIEISKALAYLFWLLLGFYLGSTIELKIVRYMREKRKN